jgi:spore photoproduct lyase
MSDTYDQKLARISKDTLLPLLEGGDRRFIEGLARAHRFSFQELKMVAQAARDLRMWREESLADLWSSWQAGTSLTGREGKKALLGQLKEHLAKRARQETRYPERPLSGPPHTPPKLHVESNERKPFGLCPAYSEKTVCCGLYTLDAVSGCPFACSYCTIQTFYGEHAVLDEDLEHKLRELDLEPGRFYHIGTGQSSDSLVWGNRGDMLQTLCDFARQNPDVLLELKTKSANVEPLIALDPPPNVVCSWTLNPDDVIANEERGTAKLKARLDAARRVADSGTKVAFHFHPMVLHEGWQQAYGAIADQLLARFSPRDVLFLTMGSVTLIRPVIQEIRKRGGESKILQMEMVPDVHGKMTYPDEVKISLFSLLYQKLAPWHEPVFFYLCMEPAPIWEATLGFYHASNQAFEAAFAEHFRQQIGGELQADR